jgi:hypothetical protein
MRLLVSIFILAYSLVSTGQSNRSFEVDEFSKLKISGPYDVELKKGSEPGVKLSGDKRVI